MLIDPSGHHLCQVAEPLGARDGHDAGVGDTARIPERIAGDVDLARLLHARVRVDVDLERRLLDDVVRAVEPAGVHLQHCNSLTFTPIEHDLQPGVDGVQLHTAGVAGIDDNESVTERAHRPPTLATVKALYWRAFRCARPECPKPLYKIDGDTGERTLNSRIAHIHARRPGGPRWNARMTSEGNRSYENLLLLCIEDSYEIDEQEDRFPPELLRGWKKSQEGEFDKLQQNWSLSDEDAEQVLDESSARAQQHAGAVVGVVRAVERLALAADHGRSGPAAAAAAWRQLRLQTRSQFLAWDSDGNRLYAEPPRIQTDQHRAAVIAALNDVSAILTPLAHDVKVELAAAQASSPAVERWCRWVSDCVDEVAAASSTWPLADDLQDDSRLINAVVELRRAAGQLAAAWRGEATEAPPSPVEPLVESDHDPDPLTVYRELLSRAQPFARVDHREYAPDLRAALVAAAPEAATLPRVLSTFALDLAQLGHLAAAVAGNASDDQLAALVTSDSQVRPLCAALLLLDESRQAAEKRARLEVAERARSALVSLWESVDWSQPESWEGNDACAGTMFAVAARLVSAESVRDRLEAALTTKPELVQTLVTSCAGWHENVDRETWATRAFVRSYRELPAWFPTEAVQSAAAAVSPHVSAAEKDSFDADTDPERLLAHVLYLAEHPGGDDADVADG